MKDVFDEELCRGIGDMAPKVPEGVLTQQPLSQYEREELFVMRDSELRRLASAFAGGIRGLYKRIFIVGERGTGKTTLVNYLARRNDRRLNILVFGTEDYDSLFDRVYNEVILYLLTCYDTQLDLRGMREDTNTAKIQKKIKKILSEIAGPEIFFQEKIKPWQDIMKLVKNELGIDTNAEELSVLLKNCGDGKFFLIFDESRTILKNTQYRQFISRIVSQLKAVEVYVLHPETLVELEKANDDILKDAVIVSIPALTTNQCKELLARRMRHYSTDSTNKSSAPIDYMQDLNPFVESAVEHAAVVSKGNPLDFICLLRDAVDLARKVKQTTIDMLAVERAWQNRQQPTSTEQKVLRIITERSGVSVVEIARELGVSSVLVHNYVHSLKKKHRVRRERDGRAYKYFTTETGEPKKSN